METSIDTSATQLEQPAAGRSRRFRVLGYIGIFLLAYAFFLIVTFPYELLAKGILSRAQGSLPFPINVERISPRFPLGAKLEGLSLGPMSTSDNRIIVIDELAVNASLRKAIKKQLDGDLSAKIFGGKIDIEYVGNEVAGDGKLRIISVNIDKLLEAVGDLPLQLAGNMGGKGEFHLDTLNQAQNSATLNLFSSDLEARQVDLMVKKVDFKFTEMAADMDLKGDLLTVKSMKLRGAPCGFDISGTIQLDFRDIYNSRPNLEIVFHPTDEFKEKMPFDALKKNTEGYHIGRLRGTFAKLKFP